MTDAGTATRRRSASSPCVEPIKLAGQVYASMEFAALPASEGVTEFACSYVGLTSFHKGYETFPLYHVHRR